MLIKLKKRNYRTNKRRKYRANCWYIFDYYFNQEYIFGLVTKSQISTEFNFEPDELIKLKFKSKKEFLDVLNEFKTDLYNRMNYEELKKCFLFKINENNKEKAGIYSGNKSPEKNINFDDKYDNLNNKENIEENEDNNNNENEEEEDDIELSEEEDNSDYLPVYNTKNIVIKYDNTDKRLEESNKLLYQLKVPPSTTDDMEEDSLELKIDLNFDKENPKEVTYYDYKKVLNKYSDKNNIDFTIPKPFDFQQETTSKINGAKKLQKFLLSRKEA